MKPSSVLAVSIALLLAAAPARADLEQLKARGALRVVIAQDERAETYNPGATGEPGFERELLQFFAGRQGLALETVTVKGYAERITALVEGQGDLIAAIFDTPERRERVAFTLELMPTYNVAVSVPPRPPVASLALLRKERLGVVGGTATVDDVLAAGLPRSGLTLFERFEPMIEALEQGGLGAAVMPVSEFALGARRHPRLQAGVTVGPVGSVAWAVRKEDRQLLAALDEHLQAARRAGTWNRLVVKYFGDRALEVLGRRK